MLNLSKHHQRQYYSELVKQLVGKHTLKIWSLMCLFVLLTGALAAVGLLDPGYDPTDTGVDASAPGLTAEPRTSAPERSRYSAKTWKMALLLLASTVSGGAIAYHLKYADWSPKPPRKSVARAQPKRKIKPKTKVKAARTPSPKASSPRNSRQRRVARSRTPNPRSRLSPSPVPRSRSLPATSASALPKSLPAARSRVPRQLPPSLRATPSLPSHRRELNVAIVPAETVMPLDRREPSLAESLDLRRRYPITSIMGETKDV
ncbi:MAG: hypothetical protein SW833_03475 [Cyanobacteriota bacterium]|nr:hypothetical protein [Cyanobacteriota bacterium]